MTDTFLITGGAGFIGSALLHELAGRGAKLIVLDALTYAGHPANITGLDVLLVEGDIGDGALVSDLLLTHRPNALFHLAAESHVDNSIASPAGFVTTNVNGTYTLLEASRQYWLTLDAKDRETFRFIQVSTDEVYGALGEEGAFRPDTPLAPNSPYSASKAAGDLLARAWHHTYGLPVITTRCSNNYGPRQHPEKLIPHMVMQALKGEKLPVYGKGNQVRDWIHVSDHARGIIAAYEKGKIGETYLFGGHEERRNIDVVTRICNLLKKHKPGPDYHALITHVEDRLGHDFRYAIDDSASIDALGWKRKVTDFEKGLEDTIAWYLANQEWVATIRDHSQRKRSAA